MILRKSFKQCSSCQTSNWIKYSFVPGIGSVGDRSILASSSEILLIPTRGREQANKIPWYDLQLYRSDYFLSMASSGNPMYSVLFKRAALKCSVWYSTTSFAGAFDSSVNEKTEVVNTLTPGSKTWISGSCSEMCCAQLFSLQLYEHHCGCSC